jgi:hypothetical protein
MAREKILKATGPSKKASALTAKVGIISELQLSQIEKLTISAEYEGICDQHSPC